MGNKLVWRPSTDDSHTKPNERKRKLENHSGMRNIRACSVAPGHCLSHSERYCERRRASDHFENLPENLLSIILSKLPLNEVVRTSVLSEKWRHSWMVCSKLCFDDTAFSGNVTFRKLQRRPPQKFIDNVNTVLRQHHDDGSVSRLQRIQLSFGHFAPPFQFKGFPNLRKLDLRMVHASGKDFQNMLTNCCKLEWLSMHNKDKTLCCQSDNFCRPMVTIDLSKTLELENVNISFNRVTLEHVIYALPYELSNTQRLTLRAFFYLPKMPYLIENPGKFSQMKHLQLQFACPEDVNISLVSVLKAAPSMEKLEMHFSVLAYFYDGVEPLMRLPKCTYRHLKDAYITGFVASKGQLEFLEHVAENAPALEVLTVDTRDFVVVKDPWEESHSKEKAQFLAAVRGTARSHVEGKIPPTCCMRIH